VLYQRRGVHHPGPGDAGGWRGGLPALVAAHAALALRGPLTWSRSLAHRARSLQNNSPTARHGGEGGLIGLFERYVDISFRLEEQGHIRKSIAHGNWLDEGSQPQSGFV